MRAVLNIGLLFLPLEDAIPVMDSIFLPLLTMIPALQLNESCCFSLFILVVYVLLILELMLVFSMIHLKGPDHITVSDGWTTGCYKEKAKANHCKTKNFTLRSKSFDIPRICDMDGSWLVHLGNSDALLPILVYVVSVLALF